MVDWWSLTKFRVKRLETRSVTGWCAEIACRIMTRPGSLKNYSLISICKSFVSRSSPQNFKIRGHRHILWNRLWQTAWCFGATCAVQVASLRSTYGDQQIIYSAHVVKLGRNMKGSDRAIILSEKHFHRLEMPGYVAGKKKPPLTLGSIQGVSLLSGPGQAIVLHVKVCTLWKKFSGQMCRSSSPERILSDFPRAVLTCVQWDTWGSGDLPLPQKNFQFKVAETPVF